MAKPIAPTPVLRGKAAADFQSKINSKRKVVKKPLPTPRAKAVIDNILADAGIR